MEKPLSEPAFPFVTHTHAYHMASLPSLSISYNPTWLPLNSSFPSQIQHHLLNHTHQHSLPFSSSFSSYPSFSSPLYLLSPLHLFAIATAPIYYCCRYYYCCCRLRLRRSRAAAYATPRRPPSGLLPPSSDHSNISSSFTILGYRKLKDQLEDLGKKNTRFCSSKAICARAALTLGPQRTYLSMLTGENEVPSETLSLYNMDEIEE